MYEPRPSNTTSITANEVNLLICPTGSLTPVFPSQSLNAAFTSASRARVMPVMVPKLAPDATV